MLKGSRGNPAQVCDLGQLLSLPNLGFLSNKIGVRGQACRSVRFYTMSIKHPEEVPRAELVLTSRR